MIKPFKGPAKQRGFLGLIALGVSALGAIGAAKEGKKANRANAAAAKNEKDIRTVRNFQAKRTFLKNFRLLQAETIATGGAIEGGLDSSRSQGQLAASRTQTQVGLEEQKKLASLDASAVANATAAQKHRNRASTISTIASVASSAINLIPTGPPSGTPVITETDIPVE